MPAGALMSRRKIMISLSPPIKPGAHARFPVGTRSSGKHGGRPRDVNDAAALSFVCPEISLTHILSRRKRH